MERITIGGNLLQGNGPGAAPVTITVEGRELVIPRCLLIDLMNVAGNTSHDEEKALLAKPLGEALGEVTISYELACQGVADELQCYREREETSKAIHDFLSSH